jgi:cell division septation protein DedD
MKYRLLLFVLSAALCVAGCAPAASNAKKSAVEPPPPPEADVREQYKAGAGGGTFLDTLNRGKELALAENDVPKLEVVPTIEFAAAPQPHITSSHATPPPQTDQRFRIQILASSQIDMVRKEKLNAESVTGLPVFMASEQSLYKLYVGDFKTKAEAEAALPGIKNQGYKDAWIVSTK